jgi:hypothetical protein
MNTLFLEKILYLGVEPSPSQPPLLQFSNTCSSTLCLPDSYSTMPLPMFYPPWFFFSAIMWPHTCTCLPHPHVCFKSRNSNNSLIFP